MTILNYDSSGFILGVDRMSNGIDNVYEDTQEIVQILKSQNQIANTRMSELTRSIKHSNHIARQQSTTSSNRNRPSTSPRLAGTPIIVGNQSSGSSRSTSGSSTSPNISRNSSNASERTSPPSGSNSGSGASGNNSTSAAGGSAERDAQGRFLSGNSTVGGGLKGMGANLKGIGQNSLSGGGVDPVLDSMREAKDLLSPLGRGAKLAGRGVKFSLSKMKSLKRREPLPNDQTRHNTENVKLLDKIWQAIRAQRGGGRGGMGGGILGSLLGGGRRRGGGLLGKLGKLLKSKLSYIGAAIGAGALASNWGDMNGEEKAAGVGKQGGMMAGMAAGAMGGAAVGSVVPIVGTAIGGLVGAGLGGWIGSGAGEALGIAASPYIESWTSAITAYNLPKKMSDTWNDGIKPFFTRMDAIAGKMNAWLEDKMTTVADTVSATGAGLSEMLGIAGLGSVSEKYESGGRGVGTVSTGKGDHGGVSYGTHQLSSKTGSMAAFLKSSEGKAFADEFTGLSAGTSAFNTKYKDVANRRGDDFKKSQKDYITRTHYAPAAKNAKEQGFDMSNRGIQEAVYSHSTQYGANHKSRFKRVSESGVDMKDNDAVLKALYADKAAYVDSDFKSSSAATRDSVINRIKSERADVLAISKASEIKKTVKETVSKVADAFTPSPSQPIDDSKENRAAVTSKTKPNSSALGVQLGGMTPSSGGNVMPASDTPMIFKPSVKGGSDLGSAPAHLPAIPMLKIPAVPTIKQRLDSGKDKPPMMMPSGGGTINQNISDRDLAHAITGGLGQGRFYG